MTNKQLKDFVNNTESEYGEDDCFGHFEGKEEKWSHDISPWVDIVKEAERIYNMGDIHLEEGSVLDFLISAVAASSWCVAIRIMARMLHLDYDTLRDFMENSEELDGYEELVAEVKKVAEANLE